MTGFPVNDQLMIRRELENFLPSDAIIKRAANTKTGGDYVQATPAVIMSGVACRIIPITMQAGRTMLASWPAAMVEKAEYVMTFAKSDGELRDGDIAEVDNIEYNIVGVRYDNGSWGLVTRALGVRVE